MQETTSLWECSSTLERKTLPQTFICRACFFFFFFLPPPFFFSYLLFISLQLKALARSTQSLEKTLVGRGVRLQEVIARSQAEKKKKKDCAGHQGLQGGSSTDWECCGAAGSCNFHSRTYLPDWGYYWVRTLDPTDHTTGKKRHLHNFYLVCLIFFFICSLVTSKWQIT